MPSSVPVARPPDSAVASPSPASVTTARTTAAIDPNFLRYAVTGDARAFRALVEEHLPMVEATAWRRLGEHGHLAADVAQAVFTQLARVARGLPRGIVIAAWLHRQAVRRAIDTVRSETRRRIRETTAAAASASAFTPAAAFPSAADPSDMLQPSSGNSSAFSPQTLSGELAPLLDEALDRLSETDRAALVLRYLEDRDLATVAARLRTTPEAARKRVARSLEKLRIHLTRRGLAIPGAAALAATLTQTTATSSQAALAATAASTFASSASAIASSAGTTVSNAAAAAATSSTALPAATGSVTTSAAAAPAAKLTAAGISQAALAAASSATGAASLLPVLTTFLMSHLSSAGAGAALILLAAGLFYQHQESEIQRRLAASSATSQVPAAAVLTGPSKPETRSPARPGFHAANADDDGPKTLPEIIEALEKLTTGPDGRLAGLRVTALLEKIPPGQYLEFLLTAESRIPAPRWRGIIAKCLAAWTPVDPGALVTALFDSDSAKPALLRESRMRSSLVLNSLQTRSLRDGGDAVKQTYAAPFREWLKRDLPAALRWVRDNSSSPMLRLDNRVIGSLSTDLLKMAAGQLPSDTGGDPFKTIAGMTENPALLRAWAEGQLKAGGSFAELAARTSGAMETRALAAQFAEKNPDALQAWVRAAPEDSPARFNAALGLLEAGCLRSADNNSVRTLDAAEYRNRAAFALENSGLVPRAEALELIASTWMRTSSEDMGDLLTWLKISGSPQEIQTALETTAGVLGAGHGKYSDALAFAADIPDPARRDSLTRGLFLRWHDSDAPAADKFLSAAPPATAAILKPLLPTDQPQP